MFFNNHHFRNKSNKKSLCDKLKIALMYKYRIGVYNNESEAVTRLLKAAKQGDPVAAHYLARAYAKGTGTHRDHTQVIHWYREAALGSNVLAREKLVELLRAGETGSTERTEACAWCVIGDETGDEHLKKHGHEGKMWDEGVECGGCTEWWNYVARMRLVVDGGKCG